MSGNEHSAERISLRPDFAGTGLLWVFSLCGVVLSVLLTLLKFRSAYGCDVSLLSACQIGGVFSCDRVLQSDWATVFTNVPISVLAAAHYAVLLGVATLVLCWPQRFLAVARPIFLWLGLIGLMVVPPLFSYSWVVAHGMCSYCLVVYGINIGTFLIAWWMHPEGLRIGLSAPLRPGPTRRGMIYATVGLAFVALVLTQMVVYREEAASMQTKARCLREGVLPATELRTDLGGRQLEVEVALFVDFACPACREEFGHWWKVAAESEGRYRLSIYHFPREGDCQPPGETTMSPNSAHHHSCLAARTVECAELRRPGVGREMVKRLFQAQDGGDEPYFTRERLLGYARELGVPGAEDGSLLGCVEDDALVLTKIHEHVAFAAEQGLAETPGAFFAFYEDGAPLEQLYLVKGAKTYDSVEKFFYKARGEVRRALGLE